MKFTLRNVSNRPPPSASRRALGPPRLRRFDRSMRGERAPASGQRHTRPNLSPPQTETTGPIVATTIMLDQDIVPGQTGGGWGIRTPEGLPPTRFPSLLRGVRVRSRGSVRAHDRRRRPPADASGRWRMRLQMRPTTTATSSRCAPRRRSRSPSPGAGDSRAGRRCSAVAAAAPTTSTACRSGRRDNGAKTTGKTPSTHHDQPPVAIAGGAPTPISNTF